MLCSRIHCRARRRRDARRRLHGRAAHLSGGARAQPQARCTAAGTHAARADLDRTARHEHRGCPRCAPVWALRRCRAFAAAVVKGARRDNGATVRDRSATSWAVERRFTRLRISPGYDAAPAKPTGKKTRFSRKRTACTAQCSAVLRADPTLPLHDRTPRTIAHACRTHCAAHLASLQHPVPSNRPQTRRTAQNGRKS